MGQFLYVMYDDPLLLMADQSILHHILQQSGCGFPGSTQHIRQKGDAQINIDLHLIPSEDPEIPSQLPEFGRDLAVHIHVSHTVF